MEIFGFCMGFAGALAGGKILGDLGETETLRQLFTSAALS
jgi:hypothetical protein